MFPVGNALIDAQLSLEGCEPKAIHSNPKLAIYEFVTEMRLLPSHITQKHCFED